MTLIVILNIVFCTAVVIGVVTPLASSIRTSRAEARRMGSPRAARPAAAPATAARRPAPARGGFARPYAS